MAGHAPEYVETFSLIASGLVARTRRFSNDEGKIGYFHNGMGRYKCTIPPASASQLHSPT